MITDEYPCQSIDNDYRGLLAAYQMDNMEWLYDTTACVDCYLTAALGAPSDDPDYVPAVVPLSSVAPGERVELGWRFPTKGMRENPDGECVLGFSWSPCECCGSTLGGDRFAVSMWTLV